MLNKLTKKTVLLGSAAGVLIAVVLARTLSHTSMSICPYEITIDCSILLFTLELFVFIPIFIFILVTYKIKEEIFTSWRKFSFIYLFIYLFTVFISPWMHADISPFEKKPTPYF